MHDSSAAGAKAGDSELNNLEKQESSGFHVDDAFEQIVSKLVPTVDNPTTPSLTFRVWLLGVFFCSLLSWVNQLFMFRTNPMMVSNFVAVLLAFPMGKFLARVIPRYRARVLGIEIDTNPGPFSVKEHVLIGIWASTGAGGIYGSENIIVQEVFYNTDIGYLFGILFLVATSTLGFGISGVCRKLLIRPAHMIWPSVLPGVALYTSFHEASLASLDVTEEKGNDPVSEGKHMSRLAMFGLSAFGMAVFYFIGPGYLAPMLQFLPLLCWFAPGNDWLQYLGSPRKGTGVLSLTLDWSVVSQQAPITVPYWSSVNLFISYVVFQWIISGIAWQGNWWSDTSKFTIPLNSATLTDKDGKKFAPRDIVDPRTKTIIESKYQASKPFLMSPFFALSYLGSMATFAGSISHTLVWYGKDIWQRMRASRYDEDDIHCKLIDKYDEVPNWWYYGFFVACLIITTITCQFSEIGQAWYHSFLSVVVAIVGTVPYAVVLATTGVNLYMNIDPGKPLLMMAFKTLGVCVSSQCLILLSDLKTGHYMKIPPRHIFITQMSAQIISCFIVYGTLISYIRNPTHVDWILKQGEAEGIGKNWGASNPNIFYNASLIWGAIGPIRFFFESVYSNVIVWGFILGTATPIVFKLCSLVLPRGIPWHLAHTSLLYTVGNPPMFQNFALTAFMTATFFQFYLYRYRQDFWTRYNYVIASGFDVGVAIVSLFITFVLSDNELNAPTWALNPSPENPAGKYEDWCG